MHLIMPGYTILIDNEESPHKMLRSVRLIRAWAASAEETYREIVRQLDDEEERNHFHFGAGI